MSNTLGIRSREKSIKKDTSSFSLKEKSNDEVLDTENEISSVFRDLHISALSKAAQISPSITSVTLGVKSEASGEEKKNETTHDNRLEEKKNVFKSSILFSSTPEKSLKNKSNQVKNLKIKKKIENLSPIRLETEPESEYSFSYQKLLNEYDTQRRLTVDKVMRERIQNMYDTNKLIRDSLEHLKQTRIEEAIARRILSERKILDDIHEQEILNKPKREAELAKNNLKEAQRIQERNQKVKEAEEEARKKSEAINIKRQQIDKILYELQKEYNQEYKNLLETIKQFKDKAALADINTTQSKLLKECPLICEGLLKKCKTGDVCEADVESAKKLVQTIRSIHECFSNEITKINEKAKSQAKEEENKKVEVEEKVVQKDGDESSASTTFKAGKRSRQEESGIVKGGVTTLPEEPKKNPMPNNLSDCFDARSLEVYLKLKTHLENYQNILEPLLNNDSLKKFKFSCQKAVTIPVNAISPVSGAHLTDKYLKLHNLLSGKTVEVGDIKITASQHALGVAYCKNLLAKKFVRQGDLTVSSKPDAAFSIATVLASLWIDFPDFGELALAHFQSACPYLAPVFMPQVEGQSDEDYHKSLGYHYSQNGEVEKQDSFLKRMSGIMRLYAALIISKVRQPGKMNPLGLSEGWRWISALLNMEPRPDICATLLYDFLEVAGNEMFRAYGGQFKKMLAYVCQEYFPKLEKVTPSSAGGPLVRLEGFLQKTLKEEFIPPPHGALPPNFW